MKKWRYCCNLQQRWNETLILPILHLGKELPIGWEESIIPIYLAVGF